MLIFASTSRALHVLLFLWLLIGMKASAQPLKTDLPDFVIERFGAPPSVPESSLPQALTNAIEAAFIEPFLLNTWGPDQTLALDEIAASGDPRLVWHIADLLRFASGQGLATQLSLAASDLLGRDMGSFNQWGTVTDHLIAWDIPAPPNYLTVKRTMFTQVVPQWEALFVEGDMDWRHVSWGGVLIDDRPFDTTVDPCNCIPAADNPTVTDVQEAAWLKDDDVVFGLVINGQARAYPRQIMEVREMINDTLGGRDLGIPYCTLCGSAQAYFTDEVPEGVARPVLRTSGLLIRSNKVMYDLETFSVLDTFTGKAVTGPLAEAGVVLPQASVITTRWGRWKETYPETTVLTEDLALGRNPDFRNTRDANGPIAKPI